MVAIWSSLEGLGCDPKERLADVIGLGHLS